MPAARRASEMATAGIQHLVPRLRKRQPELVEDILLVDVPEHAVVQR
jgi:hypothetical protein